MINEPTINLGYWAVLVLAVTLAVLALSAIAGYWLGYWATYGAAAATARARRRRPHTTQARPPSVAGRPPANFTELDELDAQRMAAGGW